MLSNNAKFGERGVFTKGRSDFISIVEREIYKGILHIFFIIYN